MNPILLSEVLLVIGGVALGAVLAFFLLPARREAKRLRAELEQARAEHEEYKSGVSDHFVKTAELVGELTKSYAAVYDHLAGGAQKFCTDFQDKALTFAERPALGDGRTFTSTAETVEEVRMEEVPVGGRRGSDVPASASTMAAAAAPAATPSPRAATSPRPAAATPGAAATSRDTAPASRPSGAATEEAPIVEKTSAPVGNGMEEPGAVDGVTEDDPLHATTGIMPEPGVTAEPGELEDGAPAAPKF
ncbi:MAG TPA: DUF1043 family protein [Candidatus Limnocylindrales bacterium]|nr:DUF1043 family protein [Candidatus Limnocylindrales bacterium]